MAGAVEMRECWRDRVQSRTSSLSKRGNLRAEAMEFAKVLLPVPGWPFIAIIIFTIFVVFFFFLTSSSPL